MQPFRPNRFPVQMPMQHPMGALPPRPITYTSGPQSSPLMPFGRMPMQHVPYPQTRGFGGLLSKLLNKGNMPMNFQGGMGFPASKAMFGPNFPPAASGGFMSSGAGGLPQMMNSFPPGGITGMLNNVQKVMGLAQQFGPMIQQYGPFIKNMPAMLKIMKEINASDPTEEKNDHPNDDEMNVQASTAKDPPNFTENSNNTSPHTVKLSKPKIYV